MLVLVLCRLFFTAKDTNEMNDVNNDMTFIGLTIVKIKLVEIKALHEVANCFWFECSHVGVTEAPISKDTINH